MDGENVHKGIVYRNHKHLASLLQVGMIDVRWDMQAGASPRKRARHTNDVPVGRLELLGKVHLVTGRVFHKAIDRGHLVANLDECARGGVEAADSSHWAREGRLAERSSEKHCDGI